MNACQSRTTDDTGKLVICNRQPAEHARIPGDAMWAGWDGQAHTYVPVAPDIWVTVAEGIEKLRKGYYDEREEYWDRTQGSAPRAADFDDYGNLRSWWTHDER